MDKKMHEKLENNLYARYSDFFKQKNLTIQQSCMSWGICTGNGWYHIIDSLCYMVESYLISLNSSNNWTLKQHCKLLFYKRWFTKPKLKHVTFELAQVKEKFGTLRIYYNGGDQYIDGMVAMAERISSRICDVCGQPGIVRNINDTTWLGTRCDEHKNTKIEHLSDELLIELVGGIK